MKNHLNNNEEVPSLSIVSPVYMAEEIVDELVARIASEVALFEKNYEIILVDDGSLDNSWSRIEKNCRMNSRIKGIKLSRNFGQHHAIAAGLAETKGNYVVVMDCDLQDNPKYIQQLVNRAKEGVDIVYTVKNERNHGRIKNLFADMFHGIFNWLVGNKTLYSNGKIGSFSCISRKVVEAYGKLKDYYRPYLVIMQWLGFSHSFVTVDHDKRFKGRSSYSFAKLINHAVNGIISQTDRLLKVTITLGFIFVITGLILILRIIIKSITSGLRPGWASTIVAIIFSTGLILSSLGITALYVAKIFEQTKERPLYLIDKKINL